MRLPLLALPLSVTLFLACGQNELNEEKAITTTARFVQPPIPEVNVPYQDYSVEAEKGDTLLYESGSILVFPSNSFVDKNGNLVKGKVKVKYREFSNPIDFFFSGIPMNYDSAGTKYNFESSGMCEILADRKSVV